MTTSTANTTIDAPPSRVWEVLVDVEAWPRWTTSMTSVQRLDEGPLQVGSAARIEQPGLRPMVWTVTDLVPQHRFRVARAPGVTVTGDHTLTPLDDDRTRLQLLAAGSGPLARLGDLLTGRRVRRYVDLEAAGLKAAAEAAP